MSIPMPWVFHEKAPAEGSCSAYHVKANTPAVIKKASTHSLIGAERFMKTWPQTRTGTSFIDLKSICVGKVTYHREAYWNQVAAALVKDGRRQAIRALPSASTPPKRPNGFFSMYFTTTNAKRVAITRLAHTRKDTEGKGI